ncbi:MAG: radical SAM protein [Planctomycetes bacterium]|nr:radical SAM protein [Planctomycetota bacterium]
MKTKEPATPGEEPRTTCSGFRLEPPKRGLPKDTHSVCPECLKTIPARVEERSGKVWMTKTCPEHGLFEDVVYSRVEHYHRMEKYRFGDGAGVANPAETGSTSCPESCGLCRRHASHTALANIDLTNRCNMTCPVCFANANAAGYLYEPDKGQIAEILRRFRDSRPVPCACVQFAGGEPTLHPDFLEILSTARALGFSAIQLATNGLKFLEPGFAEKCREAGLNSLYLQFDAMDDAAYRRMRGRPLLEAKMKVLEAVRRAGGMNVILVPTVVRGINDAEVGPILKFAFANVNLITGVSFQPVAITGRISRERREALRYTLPDLADAVEAQTGFAKADAWAPLSALVPLSRLASAIAGRPVTAYTAHHHCSMATYFFVDPDGKPTQINEFLDLEALLRETNRIAADLEASRFKFVTRSLSKLKVLSALERHFRPDRAPRGLSFKVFLDAVEQLMSPKADRKPGQGFAYRTLMVGGMHFMDCYNFDVERVSRCVVHYGAPDGRTYPFCAYNAGPTFRLKIEREFAHTPESVRRKAEAEGFPPELDRLVGKAAEAPASATGCVRAIGPGQA